MKEVSCQPGSEWISFAGGPSLGRMERRLLAAGPQVQASTGGGYKTPKSREAQHKVPERALTLAEVSESRCGGQGTAGALDKVSGLPGERPVTVIAASQLPALTGVRPLRIPAPSKLAEGQPSGLQKPAVWPPCDAQSLDRAGTVRLPQGQGQRGGVAAAARSPPPLPRPPSLPPSCSQLGGPLGREAWGAA